MQIDRNIPIAEEVKKERLAETVRNMEVGDSVLTNYSDIGAVTGFMSAARAIGEITWRFRKRAEGDKIRVWRIA